jgi:hypothetical protein
MQVFLAVDGMGLWPTTTNGNSSIYTSHFHGSARWSSPCLRVFLSSDDLKLLDNAWENLDVWKNFLRPRCNASRRSQTVANNKSVASRQTLACARSCAPLDPWLQLQMVL